MASEIVIHGHQIEMLPVSALKDYDRNARTHPDAQIALLVNVIRDAGFTNPLLIDDDDVIVGGHGRLIAAKKLKMQEVPCVRVSGLTPEQLRTVRLSDNASALLSGWDDALLRVELSDLQSLGADLSLTGFSSLELTALFGTVEGATDPDDAPEPPATPVSALGDVWKLGDHIMVCGDCTNPADVEKALAGSKPHLMVTDPPYGVNYDASWRKAALPATNPGKTGGMHGRVSNDDRSDWREAWAIFTGDVAYCWHAGLHASNTQLAFEACGFELRSQIIWAKHQSVIGRGHYHVQHEPCFYMVRKGSNGHWSGDRKQHTVWQIDKPKNSETGHSTQKPVEAMARPIRNNSQPGDHVYEPFSGSGTTIIAAQMNKRICHAIELDPAYIDVACLRFAAFSGIAPVLAETGETFEQVKARRLEVV